MAVLDDLSGFEFEDLMEDVFRNLGYENVRQASRTADEGRDILMEEVVNGTRRAVVVECKHTGTVGRPETTFRDCNLRFRRTETGGGRHNRPVHKPG
jgi:restriction endonuclease Mrr